MVQGNLTHFTFSPRLAMLVRNAGLGGAIVPQVFGRSVNPIWTRGGQILPALLLLPPLRFLEDAGSLISGLLKANSPLFVLHVNFIRRIFSQQYSVMTIWPHTVWFISILRELRMNKCA